MRRSRGRAEELRQRQEREPLNPTREQPAGEGKGVDHGSSDPRTEPGELLVEEPNVKANVMTDEHRVGRRLEQRRHEIAGCAVCGEKLELCDVEQNGWARANVCQTRAHCNAALGQCLVDPCILGEHQCNGQKLEECHANGWQASQDCGKPEKCNAAAARCE